MPNTVIQLKKSATPSAQPASLANGELALNFADGILYYKASNGTIAAISGTGTGTGSSYGVVNANGTLLLAGVSGDTFSILPGQNITITGDAINDRVTINADLTASNAWANTKLSNGSVTLAGALTTTGQITANAQINITPAGGQEGGEIQLQSTGANTNWSIDAYQNNIRIFTTTGTTVSNLNFFHAGSGFVRMGVNRADPTYTVDVNGTVNASALFVNGVQINAGTVDLSPANGYTNTSTTAANNYAGAMANAANIYATTINDANLVVARAYTNTSTTAANNYAGVMANSANAVATATFGTITNTTAAFAAANQAGVIANAAFAAGNNEFTFSNTVYAAVNSAFGVINSAFTQSNTDNVRLSAAYVSINAGYTVANAAFGKANGAVQTAYVNQLINGTTTLTPTSNNATINIGVGNVVTLVANTTNNAVIITLPASGVTAATYGNSTIIPVITVDAFGRVTSVANTTLTSTGLANTSGVSFNGDLFFPTGNVAVGASSATFNSVAYRLYVNGAFAANTKSFVIDHPTKSGLKLQHGSLEGPENGVYVRGKVQGKVIELPDYWTGLVDQDTITVQLTAIGRSQNLYVVEVSNNKVFIDTENHTVPECYYTVYGERKDVKKLVVEY